MQIRTKTPLVRIALALWVLCLGAAFLGGCHGSEGTPAPVSEANSGNLQNAGGKKPREPGKGGGGGTPDMNDYPAPSGVKTGVPQGGLK